MKIDIDDLKIDVFRPASGDPDADIRNTAVKITHIPTRIFGYARGEIAPMFVRDLDATREEALKELIRNLRKKENAEKKKTV